MNPAKMILRYCCMCDNPTFIFSFHNIIVYRNLLEYNKFYSYPITQRIKLCVNNAWFEKRCRSHFRLVSL